MSKSVVLSSVLLSGSLVLLGCSWGMCLSSTVPLQPVNRVEPVGVSGPAEPYIVEYDIFSTGDFTAARIWSDGLIEVKRWVSNDW